MRALTVSPNPRLIDFDAGGGSNPPLVQALAAIYHGDGFGNLCPEITIECTDAL